MNDVLNRVPNATITFASSLIVGATAIVAVLVGGSLTQPPAAPAEPTVKVAVQMTIEAKLSGLQLPTLGLD